MTDRPYKTGVIHGRFQVLHNDHVAYIMEGKALCEHLVIGITNPDPYMTRHEKADPHRSRKDANPLMYYERYLCVTAVMQEHGLTPDDYAVVPFPINLPELYKYYAPSDAVYFVAIYDHWGRHKLENFKSLGLKTHVLREVSPEEKGISASYIRKAMISDTPWEHLVPPCVAALMHQWGIPERLKNMDKASTVDITGKNVTIGRHHLR
jgi:nicotinamide-nucleotide adenylyltransferase